MSRRTAFLCCVAVALVPSSASAAHVQCGDVITQDTTLDSDLIDCPGHGVVIGASGITLDLAGHTIDGTGANGVDGVNNRAMERDSLRCSRSCATARASSVCAMGKVRWITPSSKDRSDP